MPPTTTVTGKGFWNVEHAGYPLKIWVFVFLPIGLMLVVSALTLQANAMNPAAWVVPYVLIVALLFIWFFYAEDMAHARHGMRLAFFVGGMVASVFAFGFIVTGLLQGILMLAIVGGIVAFFIYLVLNGQVFDHKLGQVLGLEESARSTNMRKRSRRGR